MHAQLGVEIGERLVHQEHLRLADDRPTQSDTVAARRPKAGAVCGSSRWVIRNSSAACSTRRSRRRGSSCALSGVEHVAARGHVRIQGVRLKTRATSRSFGSRSFARGGRRCGYRHGPDKVPGRHHAGNPVVLPQPLGPEQHHELAIPDLQAEVVHGGGAVEKRLVTWSRMTSAISCYIPAVVAVTSLRPGSRA